MLEIKSDTNGKGKRLITTSAIEKGKAFHELTDYTVISSPTYTSIQINRAVSIEEFYGAYLNHSCEPNITVDTTRLALIAARDIKAGEELTFFYPSTEWDMAAPFPCLCGSPTCLGLILGAKYLSLHVLSQYFINHHIGVMALNCLIRLGDASKNPLAEISLSTRDNANLSDLLPTLTT
jgi:SET domain